MPIDSPLFYSSTLPASFLRRYIPPPRLKPTILIFPFRRRTLIHFVSLRRRFTPCCIPPRPLHPVLSTPQTSHPVFIPTPRAVTASLRAAYPSARSACVRSRSCLACPVGLERPSLSGPEPAGRGPRRARITSLLDHSRHASPASVTRPDQLNAE